MLADIDNDTYCYSDNFDDGYCCKFDDICESYSCRDRHYKHPTPEQYKETFNKAVPDDMPVWYIDGDDPAHDWNLDIYINAVEDERYLIVIACTPFNKPDKDWRPKTKNKEGVI